ncbi:MAG: MOSC N-terminal beta barrel domain-containing protein [Betaproteobacteria bacterium]
MTDARITALNLHPVKSCGGIALDRATITVRGLAATGAGDREWMVVDGDGRFVSQREHPRLALVGTALSPGSLVLTAPGRQPLAVPTRAAVGATRDVVVWRSTVAAHDMGGHAAGWLSAHLGVDVRLVRFDPAHSRMCNPEFAGDSGAHTAFADGYPLLVIGEASLAGLNARLAAKSEPGLPMNRFRPNLVVGGLLPHDEDHLDTIEADGVVLKLVKPCVRCQITTTDQVTAQVGIEPLATLGGYRNDVRMGGVTFGMNAIVVAGAGRELAVGARAICTYRF